jgi:pimeloyl-ACP methyl ester carboxylesterase
MTDHSLDPAGPTGLVRFAAHGPHRLAYELVPATAPDAPTVVLLHELLAGRGEWTAQRSALAGDYRLVLPEARGHGASAALTDRRYALADLVAETLAVLDAAEVTLAHLAGHGLGGTVAWEMARLVPDRVGSLILVEPDLPAVLDGDLDPVVGSLRRETRQADRAAAEAAYKGLTDRALDAFLAPRRGPDWRARLPRSELATLRRHAGALAALLTALDAHPVEGAAPPVPTLILHGAVARPLVRLTCERLAVALPGAHLATLPTVSPTDSPLAGPAGDALSALARSFVASGEVPEGVGGP